MSDGVPRQVIAEQLAQHEIELSAFRAKAAATVEEMASEIVAKERELEQLRSQLTQATVSSPRDEDTSTLNTQLAEAQAKVMLLSDPLFWKQVAHNVEVGRRSAANRASTE